MDNDIRIPPDYVERIERLSYFKAPRIPELRPHKIPPGFEYLEILTGGKVHFRLDNGREIIAGKGSIFWHLPGEFTIHRNVVDDPYECLVILFKIKRKSKRHAPRFSRWSSMEDVKLFSDMALNSYQNSEIDKDLFCSYVFSRIKWEIYLYLKRSHFPETSKSLSVSVKFIEENFQRNISIDEVANSAGISAPSLYLIFRKHLNESPHRYILSKRIQEAKKRLAESNEGLKSIGANCGFANVETFCRVFKSYNGTTPGTYRKQFSPGFFLTRSS